MVSVYKEINGKFIKVDEQDIYFDGSDYSEKHDKVRLNGQLNVIFELVSDGNWRTLKEIAEQTGYGEASISANLRNLRKERFGSHDVRKRYRGDRSKGLFEYRVKVKSWGNDG